MFSTSRATFGAPGGALLSVRPEFRQLDHMNLRQVGQQDHRGVFAQMKGRVIPIGRGYPQCASPQMKRMHPGLRPSRQDRSSSFSLGWRKGTRCDAWITDRPPTPFESLISALLAIDIFFGHPADQNAAFLLTVISAVATLGGIAFPCTLVLVQGNSEPGEKRVQERMRRLATWLNKSVHLTQSTGIIWRKTVGGDTRAGDRKRREPRPGLTCLIRCSR
ncbi:protein of unknown function [Kyrpidia spormannii]|uniref:Uncharacterized protein n=2 Tax=Kyrpidia spormannii TaxID=2055160 RepID=A0ACA8Z509_9BACL|nr:protein of unknown function [Kyrpidia spormannii]CAB3390376.1 protein of unknown function [Kyrpidia spormannii]